MSLIVQKFGGSSVANAERVYNVADIITSTYKAGNQVIVVVSARVCVADHLKLDRSKAQHSLNKPLRDLDCLDFIIAEGVCVSLQKSEGYLNIAAKLFNGEIVVSDEGLKHTSDKRERRQQQHRAQHDRDGIQEILSPRTENVKLQHQLASSDNDGCQHSEQHCEECGRGYIDKRVQHLLFGGEAVQAVALGEQ